MDESHRLLVFCGPLAATAFESLPRPRREFSLKCRYRLPAPVVPPYAPRAERTATPDALPLRELHLTLGLAGRQYAWARHTGTDHQECLAVSRRTDAADLFRQWLQTLSATEASVNSSPLSPEFFDCEPIFWEEELLPAFETALGVELQ